MNGWIISTIVLAVILFVELVCFLTHKVNKHDRKTYPEDPEDYVPEYVSREEYEETVSYLEERIENLRDDIDDLEISVYDIYNPENDED